MDWGYSVELLPATFDRERTAGTVRTARSVPRTLRARPAQPPPPSLFTPATHSHMNNTDISGYTEALDSPVVHTADGTSARWGSPEQTPPPPLRQPFKTMKTAVGSPSEGCECGPQGSQQASRRDWFAHASAAWTDGPQGVSEDDSPSTPTREGLERGQLGAGATVIIYSKAHLRRRKAPGAGQAPTWGLTAGCLPGTVFCVPGYGAQTRLSGVSPSPAALTPGA